MKINQRNSSLVLLFSFISLFISAAPECLDNSWHLKKKYDYKEWHHVACTCPCEHKYEIAPNGTCSQCLHRRDFVPLVTPPIRNYAKLINIKKLQALR